MPIRIVSDGEYAPWYSRRACPVFCNPCIPAYMGVWPARKCVLMTGFILLFIGIILLLIMLLACIAVECAGLGGALFPIGFILIIVGLLLIHCGWAAHLLDDRGQIPIKKKTVTTTTTTSYDEDPSKEEEERLFQEVAKEPLPNVKQGYWQFDEQQSWQAVSNPYPIQHTLKYCLDRPPY
ncbi:hypothetical protein WR25_10473 [Diploscapter pachys]|uniref:Uncharacterized protein n=1 Tax=Diploscapter pachys TaxID=2018661 RepID=A0A2A2JB16_9BILA|nr:hypothetical protein WR25_10473 [Diploscapter pachys]